MSKTRQVTAYSQTNTPQTITVSGSTYSNVLFGTPIVDTYSAVDTSPWNFQAPLTGFYKVSIFINFTVPSWIATAGMSNFLRAKIVKTSRTAVVDDLTPNPIDGGFGAYGTIGQFTPFLSQGIEVNAGAGTVYYPGEYVVVPLQRTFITQIYSGERIEVQLNNFAGSSVDLTFRSINIDLLDLKGER